MRKSYRLCILALVVMVTTVIFTVVCSEVSEVPDHTYVPFPFTVVDGDGKEVIFNDPPERIVSFDSAVVEILFAIGEGHRVVGTHDFVDYPPESSDIPKLGSSFSINLEATVDLKPDLVFVFSDQFQSDLERVDLNVFYQKTLTDDFMKVADRIRMWGRITGSVDRAQYVAEEFESRILKIEETMESVDQGFRVFQDEGELWTPGPDTLVGKVFELLKLDNIAYDISGYKQLSSEIVVDRDPELIIAQYGDNISHNDSFKDLSAVKNGRVMVPRSNSLSVPGPRLVEGIEDIAKWAYPELFK